LTIVICSILTVTGIGLIFILTIIGESLLVAICTGLFTISGLTFVTSIFIVREMYQDKNKINKEGE
jgi:hypothetical protein